MPGSDPPSVKNGLVVLLFSILFTLGYGAAGFYLLDRQYNLHFDLQSSLTQTFVMFTQFYDPGLEPIIGYARYFAMSIYLVGIFTLSYAAIQLIRPVFIQGPAPVDDHLPPARSSSPTGARRLPAWRFWMTKPTFSVEPAPSWRSSSKIASLWRSVIQSVLQTILARASENSKSNADQRLAASLLPGAARSPGTLPLRFPQVLQIGQKAIVDLQAFTLAGGENKGLRLAVNRLTKLGYSTPLVAPPVPHRVLAELRQVSDEWLSTIRGTEKRFSLGWFDDGYIRSTPVMYVQEPGGRIAAFANILTEYQVNEIAIDLMRQRREGENGLMDYLIVNLFGWALESGYATFNLGLTTFTGNGEHAQDPTIERALRYIYEHVNRFHDLKGLQEYKAKFHPAWSPR